MCVCYYILCVERGTKCHRMALALVYRDVTKHDCEKHRKNEKVSDEGKENRPPHFIRNSQRNVVHAKWSDAICVSKIVWAPHF